MLLNAHNLEPFLGANFMEYKNIDLEATRNISSSLNSLAPYIGRLRPECVQFLIDKYAQPGLPIFDPFCGSGTVPLQGWINGFDVVGNDMNPYAFLLTNGKMNPYTTLLKAQEHLAKYAGPAEKYAQKVNIESMPQWVQLFFHPDTLREITSWVYYLKRNKEWFLLSCLMGILHHQRPSFLSYPASHGAPYLRIRKYPREDFPEMYTYRNVYEKLTQKVNRVYKNFPTLDYTRSRVVFNKDSSKMHLCGIPHGTILTSPPYMRFLTYARDNRLRLWFLGESDWMTLDKKISPYAADFLIMMRSCFKKWANYQLPGEKCIIVIGDIELTINHRKTSMVSLIEEESKRGYRLLDAYQDPIPEAHKLVKGNNKIKREIIIALERR